MPLLLVLGLAAIAFEHFVRKDVDTPILRNLGTTITVTELLV